MRKRRREAAVQSQLVTEEAFRVLRSNVQVAIDELDNPVILVTSANAGEGKTTVCAGLAVSLAAAGSKVVAVDLDLRHPELHKRLGGHLEWGVSDVLLDRAAPDDCLQWISAPSAVDADRGLYLLSTGAPVASPTELLGSGRTQRLLRSLSAQADVVLIDSPPVLPVADTLVIGRMAAGAILVVASRETDVGDAVRAKDALARNQTRLLGLVLNRFDGDDKQFGYGYGAAGDQPATA